MRVAGVVIIAMALAGCASPVPSQTVPPTATSRATTSTLSTVLPNPSPSAPAATLSVEIERQTVCASEGGCAVFILVRSTPGSPDSVNEDWRLQNGPDPGSFHLPPGARTTLPVGRYRVTAHVNWVSDVILNGQSPTVGGQESSCGRDLTVRASDVAVRIQVTFDRDPCEMAFTASSS